MALKAVLENVDELAEEIKKHYVEKDDKWYLDVTTVDGFTLTNTSGMSSALQKEKESLKKVKAKLAEFGDLDPTQAREAVSKMDEIVNWSPDDKVKEREVEFEKRLTTKLESEKKQFQQKFESERKDLSKRNTHLESHLKRSLIDSVAMSEIIKAGGIPELGLLYKVRESVRVDEEDNNFFARVIDSSGTVRMSTTAGNHGPMSIAELVDEMKDDKILARAFDGSGASGSGGKPSQSGSKGGQFRITAEQAKDQVLYRRLSAEAAKAGKELELIE